MKFLAILSSTLAVSFSFNCIGLVAGDGYDVYDSFDTLRDYGRLQREFSANDILEHSFRNVDADGCASICDEYNAKGNIKDTSFKPCLGFVIVDDGNTENPTCWLKDTFVTYESQRNTPSSYQAYFRFNTSMIGANTTGYGDNSIISSFAFTSANQTEYSVQDDKFEPIIPYDLSTKNSTLVLPPAPSRLQYQPKTYGFLMTQTSAVTVTAFRWKTSHSVYDTNVKWAVRVFKVKNYEIESSRLVLGEGHQSLTVLVYQDEQVRIEFGSNSQNGAAVTLFKSEFQIVSYAPFEIRSDSSDDARFL